MSSCLVIYTLFHTPPLPSSILFNFAPVVFTKGWKNPAATLQLRWINERFQIELFNCAYCFIHVTSFFAFRVYEYSFSYGNQNSDKLCSKTVRKGGPSHSDQKEKIVNFNVSFKKKEKKLREESEQNFIIEIPAQKMERTVELAFCFMPIICCRRVRARSVYSARGDYE